MTIDPLGGNVAATAGIVVLLLLVLFALAGSPLGRLVGIHPDAPFLINPTGVRATSLVVAYPAALVAVWGLTHGLVAPLVETTALPVQAGFAAAGGVLVLTGARFARYTTFLLGGRTAVEGQLSPDEVVAADPVGDDVDLAHALQAARSGQWQQPAALLGATADDDVRYERTWVLAQESVHDGQWVEEWYAARPADPLVHTVRAELALQRAWAARGAAYADQTGEQQARAFLTGLDQAERLARRAAELAPADPTPWATLVQMARGQEVPQEEFERRVQELVERAPHHVQGSLAVLQTLCAKWMGSTELMFDVARELAAEAPGGSAVCLLPVVAHVEHHLHLETGRGGPAAAARHMTSGATRTELRACVARWLAGPDGAPQPGARASAHNVVAYAFWLADDADGARPHLAAIGRALSEFPWAYSGEPGEVLGVARRWAGLPVVAPAGRPAEPEPFSAA
ncbi:hypothetical protein LY71_11526 [Geodermatophilus tzadiensis]|uniref:DUF4034 domain-containing protein n=1 Tax=Geodermatophilus tzadiensis TaxID=1137988 RepID=A0A2T0TJ43_9ACTN|nr:hypothetical protein [Geodermatophilus tzadiensis]PRY45631.1 hypothetical protein LY71_11526 [Geodermatophilus tzadiensis]